MGRHSEKGYFWILKRTRVKEKTENWGKEAYFWSSEWTNWEKEALARIRKERGRSLP